MRSRHAADLQHALDALREYCALWRLHVNVDKTKIVVFNSVCALRLGGRRKPAAFTFNGSVVECVNSYKYLGVYVGDGAGIAKFGECVQHRLTQARRVAALWRRRCKVWMFDARIAVRLFRACVMPVLDYAIGVWRPGKFAGREWDQVEQFWRNAARSILGVSVRTPLAAVFGDLGWRPYATRAAWYAVGLWARVTRLPDGELARQAMQVQRRLLATGKPCWLREFVPTLKAVPSGDGWWEAWMATPEFRLTCANTVVGPNGKPLREPWEEVYRREAEACADEEWAAEVTAPGSRWGRGGNKLRTYA